MIQTLRSSLCQIRKRGFKFSKDLHNNTSPAVLDVNRSFKQAKRHFFPEQGLGCFKSALLYSVCLAKECLERLNKRDLQHKRFKCLWGKRDLQVGFRRMECIGRDKHLKKACGSKKKLLIFNF